MGYMASWGPMGFIVSPQKIITLEKFTTSMTLKEDSENDTSGTEPTNTRGRNLIPMAFTETCVAAAGVDPLTRYSMWGALLGHAYPLIIGGKRIGPARMKLKNVSMSDTKFSSSGAMIMATLSISLEEMDESNTSALLEDETEVEAEAEADTAAGADAGAGAETGTVASTVSVSGGVDNNSGIRGAALTVGQKLKAEQKYAINATFSSKEKRQIVFGSQAGVGSIQEMNSNVKNLYTQQGKGHYTWLLN